MRNSTRFGLAAVLLTSVAGFAAAQNRDGANKPAIGVTPAVAAPATPRADSTDKYAQKIDARQPLSPRSRSTTSAPPISAASTCSKSPKDDQVRSPASRSRSAARSRRSSRASITRTRRNPVLVQRRQREPAHHHRPRLQQRRRQPERERADRPRDPRRDDVVPLGAPPPGDVGQGRLSPHRRRRRSTTRCSTGS